MALREDYYTQCANEIDRKIDKIDQLIDEIKPHKFKELLGLENSRYTDDIEDEIIELVKVLNDMQDMLRAQKSKLRGDY